MPWKDSTVRPSSQRPDRRAAEDPAGVTLRVKARGRGFHNVVVFGPAQLDPIAVTRQRLERIRRSATENFSGIGLGVNVDLLCKHTCGRSPTTARAYTVEVHSESIKKRPAAGQL